ncbi:MAG: hypothetical protein ACXW3G_00575 [Rhodoplanes sp.]
MLAPNLPRLHIIVWDAFACSAEAEQASGRKPPNVANPPNGVIALHISTKAAQERAEASFKKKEKQLEEGQKARAEYEAHSVATREKTARLRELRLAHEASDRAENPSPKKSPAAASKSKR